MGLLIIGGVGFVVQYEVFSKSFLNCGKNIILNPIKEDYKYGEVPLIVNGQEG